MRYESGKEQKDFSSRNVLVTGASGAVGREVCRGLRAAGFRVRAVGRSAVGPEVADESFVAALDDRNGLSRAMAGVDTVIHLAALLHINNPAADLKQQYWKVNVDGTRHVCEAAAANGVNRVVLASTVNVYGSALKKNGVVNESTVPQPSDWYSESKLAAEGVALEFPNTTVWRLAAVYGRGLKGNYRTLLNLARRGLLPCLGDGQNRRTLVHATDVARAAILFGLGATLSSRVWNLCDPHIPTLNEILDSMKQAGGNRARIVHIPAWLARGGLGAVESACGIMGRKAPVGRWLVDKMCEDVAVDGSALWRELGMSPAVSLVDGWRDAAGQLNLIETLESARPASRAA